MSSNNISTLAQASSGLSAISSLIKVTPNSNAGISNQTGPIQNLSGLSGANVPNGTGLPQLLNFAPAAILFNYEGENVSELESDITTHYTEANSPINDNIALKPEIIRTSGFIGELNDIIPGAQSIVQLVESKLSSLGSYIPGFSTSALIVINEAILAYETANSLVQSIQNAPFVSPTKTVINGAVFANQTQQQIYYAKFYQYWLAKTLFTVQTPWAIFNNMVIKNLRAVQSADTQMVTDFEVTFQRFYVSYSTVNVVSKNSQGTASNYSSSVSNNGGSQLATSANAFPFGSVA